MQKLLLELVTPPVAANLPAVSFVFMRIHRFLPSILLESAELIGSATVPIATFILGAVLGSISFHLKPYIFDAVRVTLIKMIFVPLCTVTVLYLADLNAAYPLLTVFFVIQASSAPAVSTIILVQHYGGDEQKISSIILFTYIVCLFSMPFWVALWKAIS